MTFRIEMTCFIVDKNNRVIIFVEYELLSASYVTNLSFKQSSFSQLNLFFKVFIYRFYKYIPISLQNFRTCIIFLKVEQKVVDMFYHDLLSFSKCNCSLFFL